MITPFTSIQIPWRISKVRKAMMDPLIISMQSIGVFWTVWGAVYGANK